MHKLVAIGYGDDTLLAEFRCAAERLHSGQIFEEFVLGLAVIEEIVL